MLHSLSSMAARGCAFSGPFARPLWPRSRTLLGFGTRKGGDSTTSTNGGAVTAANPEEEGPARVFLDFGVADEMMMRRVIVELRPDCGGPATGQYGLDGPLRRLCTGQFVDTAGNSKISLRGRPLVEAIPGVGIRGAVVLTDPVAADGDVEDVEADGDVEDVEDVEAAALDSVAQEGLVLLREGDGGLEFVFCTGGATTSVPPPDMASMVPEVAGRVVYGMGQLRLLEKSVNPPRIARSHHRRTWATLSIISTHQPP